MSRDDWLQWLDRALDGEELSGRQADALAEDLAASGNRRHAAAWMGFEAQLRAALEPTNAEKAALSKERLLATAALREKGRQRERSGRRRRWVLAGLAAAAVLVAAVVAAFTLRPSYPQPQAAGHFRIVGQAAGQPVRRGDRLVAEGGGARLRLGGYCDLRLAPGAEVHLEGEAKREAVELARGELTAAVTPGKGQFRVRTPLGALNVVGTEFTVTVNPVEPEQGEQAMSKLNRMAVVTVMVVSGAVSFQMGQRGGVLRAGMGEAFAGEEGGETGVPASLRGFRGILVGRVLAKSRRTFAMTVKEVKRQWKRSRAERPEAAVGRAVIVHTRRAAELPERHLRTLRDLRAGDWVQVEVVEKEGALEWFEMLRKIEAPARDREGEQPRHREEEGEEAHRRHPQEGEHERDGDREGEHHPEEAEHREHEEREHHGDREGEEGGPVRFPDWDEADREGEEHHVEAHDEDGEREEGHRRHHAEDREGEDHEERRERRHDRDLERKLEEGRAHHWRDREGEREDREREGDREGEHEERPERAHHDEGEREGGEHGAEERRLIEAIRGFRGVLEGTVRRKVEHGFVLEVERVVKVVKGNRAEHPRELAGHRVRMTLRHKGRTNERLARALAQVHEGGRVVVGAIHLEGEVFAAVKGLKKVKSDF